MLVTVPIKLSGPVTPLITTQSPFSITPRTGSRFISKGCVWVCIGLTAQPEATAKIKPAKAPKAAEAAQPGQFGQFGHEGHEGHVAGAIAFPPAAQAAPLAVFLSMIPFRPPARTLSGMLCLAIR
ncbi:MAG: hypothetical protein LBJ61_05870 [Deltaproteobacteria bacterium]|nr:hypothetical protein [Deltaproteobacteria bacterium]